MEYSAHEINVLHTLPSPSDFIWIESSSIRRLEKGKSFPATIKKFEIMRLCRRKHALIHLGPAPGSRHERRFFVSVLCSGNAGSEVRMTKQLKRGEGRRATDRPMETVRLLRSYIYSGNGRTTTVGVPQIDLFPGSLPLPSFLCRIRTKQRKEGPFSLHLPKRYGGKKIREHLYFLSPLPPQG